MQIVTMSACLGVSALHDEPLLPFAYGIIACCIVGLALVYYAGNVQMARVGRREGMLTVTMTWLVLSLLASIPLMAGGITTDFGIALFETISGFTTTGTTSFDNVNELPRGILFLRAFMQWQGGIGIVVFTVALIPVFGGGASQIFDAETTGVTHDRFLPRISDVAKRLTSIYIIETVVLVLLLWAGPMSLFDAVCHALSCISTGGYSTHNTGINYYNSPYVEYVITLFMFIGSLNLTLVYFLLLGKPRRLFKDEEFRWFTLFLLCATAITAWWLWRHQTFDTVELTFRKSLFHIVSLGSSTGFAAENMTHWLPFFWVVAIIVMFINGCAGSTSGGLKMVRFMILIKNLRNEFRKQIQPHLVTPVVINKRQVSLSVVHQVLAFCVLYIVLLLTGATLLMLDGGNFAESMTMATSCISNSGPGIGIYADGVAGMSDFTRGVLCFLMLAGRLEVFTVIGILTPYFWRK